MLEAVGEPVVPKKEHSREPSLDSAASSASAGGAAPGIGEPAHGGPILDGPSTPPPEAQAPKRKGGRKPIYATSEERKQRNRQAQAAFRERRTEYIKQLETTIKQYEEQLQSLQLSHRSAADECLILRYKNSLLERILLEKNIDVQAELKKKEISIPTKVPPSLPQPTPIQRAAMNRRHQYSRSGSGSISLMHTGGSGIGVNHSPTIQSSTSQDTSPMAMQSPGYAPHIRSNSMGFKAPPPLRVNPVQHLSSPTTSTPLQAIAASPLSQPSSAGLPPSHQWSSPFETHMRQLEQEYDAHADMIDDHDTEDLPNNPAPCPQGFSGPFTPQQCIMPAVPGASPTIGQLQATNAAEGHASISEFDPFDPMMDADPFGLSASLHFPTQFSFQESSMRK